MADVLLNNVRISGIVSVVPSGVISIEEENSLSNVASSKIERLKRDIGFNQRHITLKNECASDLCEQAAEFLLSKLELNPAAFDGLIMVTQTPDYFQPATSCVLHGKLDFAPHCATFDVNLGCSGYVYGLWLAFMMISSGCCERVMLLAGDTTSRCVSPTDQTTAPLFGDAGSATIIEKGSDKDKAYFTLNTDGKGSEFLMVSAGAFRNSFSTQSKKPAGNQSDDGKREDYLYMNGVEVFNFTIKEVPDSIKGILSFSGWEIGDIEFFFLHQANKFIIKNIARKIQVPIDKIPYNVFEMYGNQSSASIPTAICENFSDLVKEAPKKVILSGFGVGLSWASCAMELEPGVCFPVQVAE